MHRTAIRRQFIERVGVAIKQHTMIGNGLETCYITTGEGAPLVLLHGALDCGALSWYSVLPALAKDFRVIAPDCPGYGESAKPVTHYNVAFYVEWLHSFFQKLDLPPAILMGSSQGGAIALHYAIRYPQHIKQLVLVNSAGLVSQYSVSVFGFLVRSGLLKLLPLQLLERWLENYLLVNRTQLDERFDLLKQYEKQVTTTLKDQQSAYWRRSIQITRALPMTELRQVSQQTLLLWGEHDYLFPARIAQMAAQAIPQAYFQLIPEAGHAPHLENPNGFLHSLHTFLQERLLPAAHYVAPAAPEKMGKPRALVCPIGTQRISAGCLSDVRTGMSSYRA